MVFSDGLSELVFFQSAHFFRGLVDADIGGADWDTLELFKSTEAIPNWTAPAFTAMSYQEMLDAEEDTETVAKMFDNGFGDSPTAHCVGMLFSDRSLKTVRPILEKSGELLPIEIANVDTPLKYFTFHCMKIINLIDIERSEVERYPHGRIRRIIKPYCYTGISTRGFLFRLNVPDPYRIFAHKSTAEEILEHVTGLEVHSAVEGC